MPKLKSSINGYRIHYKKDKLGYVKVSISGKDAKKIMAKDRRNGGWHFGRKYGNKTHAYNVIKTLLEK